MTQWYARGEVGEYVLDQVESLLDGIIDMEFFTSKLQEIGMDQQEIQQVYAEEVLEIFE